MANPSKAANYGPDVLNRLSELVPWVAGGTAAGAAGVGLAELLGASKPMEGEADKERIRRALALDAIREGADPDEQLLKMYMPKKAADAHLDRLFPALMGAGAITAVPALSIAAARKEARGEEDLDRARAEAFLARGLYSRALRKSVLDTMGVSDEDLKGKVREMEGSAPGGEPKLAFEVPAWLPVAGAGAGATALSALTYKHVADSMKPPGKAKLEEYRRQAELSSHMSNKPVGGGGVFSPEEMLAIELLRTSKSRGRGGSPPASRIKADLVKNTKGGAEPAPSGSGAEVSASPSDPELERLLASV